MASLLCQGRSVSPSKCSSPGLQLRLMPNNGTISTGITRSGTTYQSYKLRANNDISLSTPMELQGRNCKGVMSVPNTRKLNNSGSYQQYQSKRCGSYIDVTEGTHKLCKTRPKTSLGARHAGDLPVVDADDKKKPKIFLESSPSGNNINFTCRIDKRLLRSPTSMAIHIDDYGQPKLNISASPELAAHMDCPTVEPPAGDSAGCHDAGPSSGGTPTQDGQARKLSKENMHIFEQSNVLSAAQKKKNVENWIDNVNSARQMMPLLQSHRLRGSASRRTVGDVHTPPPPITTPTQKRDNRYSSRRSPVRAHSPFGLAVRRLATGMNTSKNNPASHADLQDSQRPTTSLGVIARYRKDMDCSPVPDATSDKLKKQKRKVEPNRFSRVKQDNKVDASFSNEMYDAFALKKVKKRANRITLKKDIKPQLCKSPVVPNPNTDEGCSLM